MTNRTMQYLHVCLITQGWLREAVCSVTFSPITHIQLLFVAHPHPPPQDRQSKRSASISRGT